MLKSRFCPLLIAACVFAATAQTSAARRLCVNKDGSHGCYSSIQTAVGHASANDVINVGPGTYKEDVTIGVSLTLLGTEAGSTIIDATGLANGIFVDGLDYPGLDNVTIAGFTVRNALYEGILVVSASDVTIRDSRVLNNDTYPPAFTGVATGCPGQPAFETDETGDCGGAIHLIGTVGANVSNNVITGNADGVLISDETAEAHDNIIVNNIVNNNPLDCGLVLASHPRLGDAGVPSYQPHYGIDHNTLAWNSVSNNGVQVQGAGVGLFSDGNGPGRVSENLITHNTLTGNGIGGVSLHSHVGPTFGAPPDNMDSNQIIDNFIAGNLADTGDTATPGRVGININSGGGGSLVTGTVIVENVIRDEDVDVAINTPAYVDIHFNDLLGGKIGVANVCAYDKAANCSGVIDASLNYWGCPAGPGGKQGRCSTTYGTVGLTAPWLQNPSSADGHP